MRKAMILVVAMGVLCAQTAFAANQVRISQVYGGGGGGATTPATYAQDYVEIYNSGGTAVNIGNWVLEYGSATGNWGSSAANIFTFPAGTILPGCKYILVALGSASLNMAVPPVPNPDFSNTTTNMAAASGKIGLFNASNANVACGSETAGTLVDKVAYGTSNCPENTATAVLTTTTADVRNGAGTVDTDNNSTDFTITANAVPHNSQSPGNPACTPIAVTPATWGATKALYN